MRQSLIIILILQIRKWNLSEAICSKSYNDKVIQWKAGTSIWVHLTFKPVFLTPAVYWPPVWKGISVVRGKKTPWGRNFRLFWSYVTLILSLILCSLVLPAALSSMTYTEAACGQALCCSTGRCFHCFALSQISLHAPPWPVEWPWCGAWLQNTARYISLGHSRSSLIYCHILFLNVCICSFISPN